MKIYLYFFIAAAVMLAASCDDSSPAGSDPAQYNPTVHKLEKIELNGAETLALSPADTPVYSGFKIASQPSCDDLGELKGAIYERLGFIPGNTEFTPCFKNVGFWKDGAIFGQYRPADSSLDVWFVTDEAGNVHHLPGMPYKDSGFKNGKRIRLYKDKPVYLTPEKRLATFDMSTDEETELTDYAVWRYAVLRRVDGDHLVYQDIDGAGKRIRPTGATEALGAINNASIFYANESQDLEYNAGMYLKRIVFSQEGEIVSDASTVVPVAYAEWLNGAIGEPMPTGPIFSSSMGSCEKLENIMICGGKGYVIADSSADMREVNWCDFGHCGILAETQTSCINNNDIFFYSQNTPAYGEGQKITKINRTLTDYLNIFTNVIISELACSDDGGILVKGYNIDTENGEEFHYKNSIKTFLTAPVSEFIR